MPAVLFYTLLSISIIAVLEPLLSKSSQSVTFLRDTLEAETGKKEFQRRKELSVNFQLSIFVQIFSSSSDGEREVGKTRLN